MPPNKTPPFLRVVEKVRKPRPIGQDDFQVPDAQNTLFAGSLTYLILFVHFEIVNESDFLSAILNARPKYILDLRIAPRFDLGTLNRRTVFSIFQQIGAQYYDIAGKLGITSPRDARLNPGLLVDQLHPILLRGKRRIEGPLAFLVGNQQADERYESLVAAKLESFSEKGWDILRVPRVVSDTKASRIRDLVFISHASPEDSDFARWLAAHLSSLGYKVWSDVTSLIGGEQFWDDIEIAIREYAAKVIVCLSRVAQKKQGVLDEIACAVATERSKGLENFVVPIRLDDIPFTDVRANIGRKNIIDFNSNWASGLSALLKAFERHGVPRPLEDGPGAVALMSRLHQRSTSTIVAKTESLFANWFRILSFPESITFAEFDGPIHNGQRVRELIDTPTFGYLRLIGSFASPNELQQYVPSTVRISERCTIPTSKFLHGHTAEVPGMSAKDARNSLVYILRKGWDLRARKLGLLAFQTASGAHAWYPPQGLITNDAFQFIGPSGTKIRKNLVGWSKKRKVHWHFAIEATPVITTSHYFTLRPHILFTEDGRTPLQSMARMHALRRGFCRNWWNDRWRDLIAAFAAWFAQGEDNITIPLSNTVSLHIDSRMIEFTSPIALASSENFPSLADSDFAEPDWSDDPELEESEIDSYQEIAGSDDADETMTDDDD